MKKLTAATATATSTPTTKKSGMHTAANVASIAISMAGAGIAIYESCSKMHRRKSAIKDVADIALNDVCTSKINTSDYTAVCSAVYNNPTVQTLDISDRSEVCDRVLKGLLKTADTSTEGEEN